MRKECCHSHRLYILQAMLSRPLLADIHGLSPAGALWHASTAQRLGFGEDQAAAKGNRAFGDE